MPFTRDQKTEISEIIKETIVTLLSDGKLIDNVVDKVMEKVESKLSEFIKSIDPELARLKDENRSLSSELDNLQQYLKRNNVRIFGTEESPNEDVQLKIMSTLKEKTNLDSNPESIARAHRVIPRVGGKQTMETNINCSSKLNNIEETNFLNIQTSNSSRDGIKRKHFPTWWENLSYYFSQFCNSTSIHGIKYVGERGRFAIEKLIWTIILTIVCCCCISLIFKAYNKWVTSPVIVTFATTETAISKIPFPAITICPEVKSDPEIFNYTHVLLKKVVGLELNETEERYFETFSLICNGIGAYITKDHFDLNLTVSEDVIFGFFKAHPVVDPFHLTALTWLQKEYPLDMVFSGTFTSEGFCYSFNMLEIDEILSSPAKYVTNRTLKGTKPRNWSLEGGYSDDDKMDTFPRRAFISGIKGGFVYDMFTNYSHLDYLCGESLQGFKVTLHHPAELPDMDNYFRVPLDQAVYVGIKPRMITVSEALRSYRPEDRKCYFDQEKHLKFFKSYTQNNCLHECLSNYTSLECGCSAFFMAKDVSTPICGAGSHECLERSKINYLSNHKAEKALKMSPCVCLPSCTSLEYDVEISQTDWNWRRAFDVFNRLGAKDWSFDYAKTHISKFAVFYKEMQFLTSERKELYGYVDFFSNTGGLLGLFIGLSVTSLVEILYFLTLRLVCNIRKFGQAFWSGEAVLINDENSSKE